MSARPERLINSASWATPEQRELVVEPSDWLRQAGASQSDPAWAELIADLPSADQPGMADQFRCHLQFAPQKKSFDLEPWRPAVGYQATVVALCNPSEKGSSAGG